MFIILCVLCKSVSGIYSVVADFAEHISFISNTKTADAFQLHPFLFNAITVYVLKASNELARDRFRYNTIYLFNNHNIAAINPYNVFCNIYYLLYQDHKMFIRLVVCVS